jgi:hypothetical protein
MTQAEQLIEISVLAAAVFSFEDDDHERSPVNLTGDFRHRARSGYPRFLGETLPANAVTT